VPLLLTERIRDKHELKDLQDLQKAVVLDLELGLGTITDDRNDPHSLQGYVFWRWPPILERIDEISKAYAPIKLCCQVGIMPEDSPPPSRPSEGMLDELKYSALKLNSWLESYEAQIQRYGLETTDTADRPLTDTERRILARCRHKAHKGERIAHHLGLSWDHTRRLLARLVRERHLRKTGDGYRTVRRAT
jgi:hypothetical protein